MESESDGSKLCVIGSDQLHVFVFCAVVRAEVSRGISRNWNTYYRVSEKRRVEEKRNEVRLQTRLNVYLALVTSARGSRCRAVC